jgi:tetratricopeptide (TPR) repeat protein
MTNLLKMERQAMKEPNTPEEVLALHKILRADPQRYIQIVSDWIRENPENSHAYFDRHQAWMKIDQPLKALEDISKSIELNPAQGSFGARADVYRHLGEYEKALIDYQRADRMDPAQWQGDAFGLLLQADTHARLGDEQNALDCCARLPNDFWTPGLHQAPAGDKFAVAKKLKLVAAQSKLKRG